MKHVMLDLETFGTRPGCVVPSFGATVFDDVDMTVGGAFYRRMNVQMQLDRGLFVQGDTLRWWMEQSEEARTALFKNVDDPVPALAQFAHWFTGTGAETIWGHGATFDLPILDEVFERFGVRKTWGYRVGRDTRTLFDLAGAKMGDFGTPNGVAHDALSDAIYQAHETLGALAKVRSGLLK